MIIAEIIGWVATFFRSAGMIAKNADTVKALVSTGNAFWFFNGALTGNVPLMASNGICLLVVLWEIWKRNDI